MSHGTPFTREHPVVAVIRAPSHDAAKKCVAALVSGGVTSVEITFSTPCAEDVIASLKREHGHDVQIGAGTVRTPEQVRSSVDAGADYLVCPGTSVTVAAAMSQSGLPFALGAVTPTEVMTAHELGASIVKLFPGSLGGPRYVAALREPFPDVSFMPTGGVSVDNVADWFEAGVTCVGVGGSLAPAALMKQGNFAEIEERARRLVAAVPR